MKTAQRAIVTIIALYFSVAAQGQKLNTSSEAIPRQELPQSGTFWMAKGPGAIPLPPLPWAPDDLNVPIYSLGGGNFLVDDRDVDYSAQQQEVEAAKALAIALGFDTEGQQQNDPQSDGLDPRDPNGIYLDIEAWPIDGKYISFNTCTGLVYHVEESTNLVDWTLYDTIVANDTNESFFLYDGGTRFFRAVQLDNRIQFPNWDDEVEQFLYFDVSTSIQGTFQEELYADGQLVFQTTAAVPSNGRFGVYDQNYDPTTWPNAGYYAVDNWELRVTVTPAGGGGGAATATVKKTFRKPYQGRRGLTVQQYNAFTISFLIQDDIDEYMLGYFLAGLQTTRQFTLAGAPLNEFIDRTQVPRLEDAAQWAQFRYDIYHSLFTDLHYFGHGAKNHLGSGGTTNRLDMWVLDRSPYLSTNRMRYVALDGCNTAEKTTFLKGWVGYDTTYSRTKFQNKGWLPRFGWGWKDAKGVAYVN